jgi:hypothetical protein
MQSIWSSVGRAGAIAGAASWAFLVAGNSSSQSSAPPAMAAAAEAEVWTPQIPRTWDEEELATLEVPLAYVAASSKHASANFYYSIPVRTIYKSYPVYHPDREPPGYLEDLRSREPEVAFDPAKLKTKEDWIRAGELVFDRPLVYDALAKIDKLHDPEWYRQTGVPVAADGTVPFVRYFVLEKGKVAVGEFSCATCHTRVMADGSTIKGAQGNYPLGHLDALNHRERAARASDPAQFLKTFQMKFRTPYGAPWLGEADPAAHYAKLSAEEIAAADDAVPPGVQARIGTSAFHPVQVPDLIGLKDRRYFDRTGHVRHRSIGDLMRYAALNQGMSYLAKHGDFVPLAEIPDPKRMTRYSDEQLYALSLYLYSLEPPPNPNRPDALSEKGRQVFQREECDRCHTPPLYTNNRLTSVDGFVPPADHPQASDISGRSVGTDPGLALLTRRGTGLYKVPSLKGVWYRGPFEHSGSIAALEDWFDPRRHSEAYVPTGFRGAGVKTRSVKGHPFGLELSQEDRAALIAFLKTL